MSGTKSRTTGKAKRDRGHAIDRMTSDHIRCKPRTVLRGEDKAAVSVDLGANRPCLAVSRPDPDLWDSIARFSGWLDRVGLESYDPYDIWGTSYGLMARRLYYRKQLLGYVMSTPLLLLDVLCPGLRRVWVRKQRYATADAQLALGFLNLYRFGKGSHYLDRATVLADDLLRTSIPGYHGHCWGYPFDWQNNKGLWKRNVPYITATPYCFEAFLGLHEATGEARHLAVAKSIARFVALDLVDTPIGANAAAGSYSPHDQSQVVNASAYRAFVLFEAASRFGEPSYAAKARDNLSFILRSQSADGSWLYGLDEPADRFIDHFHSCFVLKNLVKINRRLGERTLADAIRRGWDYYRQHLFESDDTPRSFAKQPRMQLARVELYNVAEAITLGALLRDDIPEAYDLAGRLAGRLIGQYQLADGHFVTRVYRGGLRHTFPFLRWPQAQLFYALTNLVVARAHG